MQHADLSGADLTRADLRGASVTNEQLASACGDGATLLPAMHATTILAPCR